jgi:DNA-3-methyladenine glycosylase
MRLTRSFFERDVLEVAPDLLGKTLARRFDDGTKIKKVIMEVEAYRGEEDLACHAKCGKTKRNKVMYEKGGYVYVYFVYGMYWMLNIVTGKRDAPQAVLIRSLDGISGPGRVGKFLNLDKSFYGEDVTKSNRIWLEDIPSLKKVRYKKSARVGVDYAGTWAHKNWRFILSPSA